MVDRQENLSNYHRNRITIYEIGVINIKIITVVVILLGCAAGLKKDFHFTNK